MRTELKYIELKSGFSDNGTAWIGLVSFSKSGKTIYFDGNKFKLDDSKSLSVNGTLFMSCFILITFFLYPSFLNDIVSKIIIF